MNGKTEKWSKTWKQVLIDAELCRQQFADGLNQWCTHCEARRIREAPREVPQSKS